LLPHTENADTSLTRILGIAAWWTGGWVLKEWTPVDLYQFLSEDTVCPGWGFHHLLIASKRIA
jgi:hypothetical protein